MNKTNKKLIVIIASLNTIKKFNIA